MKKEIKKVIKEMVELGYDYEKYETVSNYVGTKFEKFSSNKINGGYIVYFNERVGEYIFTTQLIFS